MSNEVASNARVTDEELIAALRFLAVDCEYTDGWEAAAPSLILAADRLEALTDATRLLNQERAEKARLAEALAGYGKIDSDLAVAEARVAELEKALRVLREAIEERHQDGSFDGGDLRDWIAQIDAALRTNGGDSK